MTREEEIKKASGELFNSAPCSKTYKMGFEAGAMWADNNPKSSWISVEADLPCNHKEFIEDAYFTKPVLVVLEESEDYSSKHIEVCRMFNTLTSTEANWRWCNGCYHNVLYWMPLPDMPD